MFQGAEWERNQDLLENLRVIAADAGMELATMVVAWTIQQKGITTALCGAKRAWQIQESAVAGSVQLSAAVLTEIDVALKRRGSPVTRAAV
jgi:aryl-alcohol dehydrogenase-like predicted oxidoreductase